MVAAAPRREWMHVVPGGLELVTYVSARDKSKAVARMYFLGGREPEPLGPGSKEKRSAIEALGSAIGLDLVSIPGKVECCRLIAEELQVDWNERCWSIGDTVTLHGLNLLVDAVVARKSPKDGLARAFYVESVMEARGAVAPPATPPSDDEGMGEGDGKDTEFDFWDDLDPEDTDDEPDLRPAEETAYLTVEQRDIAERVAALSRPAPAVPKRLAPARAPLDTADIRFADGSWRAAVVEVQGWLHLVSDLDPTSDESLAVSLYDGLGDVNRANGPAPGWLDEAWARLNERLERALTLREVFEVEVLGADDTAAAVAAASVNWEKNWDDAEEEEQGEVSGPIQALADTWPIADFRQHARDGELDLSPSYQRADVWPTSDAQILIESVLRGIPLPSVILLQRPAEGMLRFEVVDGKQRLTSILRFTASHPTAIELVNYKAAEWGIPDLLHAFQEDYQRFKRVWKEREGEALTATREREYYFPFPLRATAYRSLSGELEGFRGKYYSEIRNLPITVVGEPRVVRYLFEQTAQYRLPVIVYKQVSSEQIHEVFSLYNKQGKHLNAEEIRNALYHHLALMKGLLVGAGDTQDLDGVAPFLAPVRGRVTAMGRTLGGYGFARAGFRRTKLLAWAASALLVDDGRPDARSTASHINLLFKRVDGSRQDRLRSADTVRELVDLLGLSVETHRSLPTSTWYPSFRNSQGYMKWQELQLVAVLIAFAAAGAVCGPDLPSVVHRASGSLADMSASSAWERPAKTQSKVQWEYTARIVRDILDALGVPPGVASEALRLKFGSAGLDSLLAIALAR